MNAVLERCTGGINSSVLFPKSEICSSAWTSPAVNLWQPMSLEIENFAERLAGRRLMNMIASFQAYERIQDISAMFAEGYLREPDPIMSHSTANSIDQVFTEVQAERAKEQLILQLTDHVQNPITYKMEDNSKVIEFFSHPSRLVCVFDDEGVQLLWRVDGKPNSEMIKNNRLNFEKISLKIALILDSQDRTENAVLVDASYALAC